MLATIKYVVIILLLFNNNKSKNDLHINLEIQKKLISVIGR